MAVRQFFVPGHRAAMHMGDTVARQRVVPGPAMLLDKGTGSLSAVLDIAVETDSAFNFVIPLSGTLDLAVETDSAFDITPVSGTSATSIGIDEYPMGASNANRVFQRDCFVDYRVMTITGVYTGVGFVRLNVQGIKENATDAVPLTEITALEIDPVDLGAGHWRGTCIMPSCHDGLRVKWKAQDYYDPSKNGTQTRLWAVGAVALFDGQSNNLRMLTITGTTQYAVADPYTWFTSIDQAIGGGWWDLTKNADGSAAGNSGKGRGLITFAAQWRADIGTNLPLGIIFAPINGSQLNAYVPEGGTWWVQLLTNFDEAKGVSKQFEKVFWYEGGTASFNSSANPAGYYDTKMQALVVQHGTMQVPPRVAALPIAGIPQGFAFGIGITGSITTDGPSGVNPNNDYMDIIRHVHFLQSRRPGCFLIGSMVDIIHDGAATGGGVENANHSYAEQYSTQQGTRWAKAAAYVYGKVPYPADGMYISSVKKYANSNIVDAIVTHLSGGTALRTGDGGTTGANLIGFIIKVNGVLATILSTAFVGNKIRFLLDTAISSADTVTLNYAPGHNPWGWEFPNELTDADKIVYDNNGPIAGGGLGRIGAYGTKGYPLLTTVSVNGGASPNAGNITASLGSLTSRKSTMFIGPMRLGHHGGKGKGKGKGRGRGKK